jgi:hypothetical protein
MAKFGAKISPWRATPGGGGTASIRFGPLLPCDGTPFDFEGCDMPHQDVTIAIFADQYAAESAIKKLCAGRFDLTNLSIVGKKYHADTKLSGFYSAGGQVKFWGSRGTYWGGLWSLFVSGASLTIPAIGPVMVLGCLAGVIIGAVEGGVLVRGLSTLGAALYSLGTPKDSVLLYEQAVKADGFLIMARGSIDEMTRAEKILESVHRLLLDRHDGTGAPQPMNEPARVSA